MISVPASEHTPVPEHWEFSIMERKRKTEIRPETPFPITDCYFPGHIFLHIEGAQLRPTGQLRSFYDGGRNVSYETLSASFYCLLLI